jgi:hypothetical protein
LTGADVSDVHGLSPVAALAKGTLVGRMALTARRCRRAPVVALRAHRADRADRLTLPPRDGRRSYRALYLVPVGPGEWPALRDTIESILHYEGADAKVVVADDGSVDSRAGVVRASFPQVDVVRSPWPTSGAFRIYPMLARVVQTCLRRYDFDVLGKLDTDALMTGSGLGAYAASRFRENPTLGMIGTYRLRGDGVPEDYTFDQWLLSRQLPRSRALTELVEAARRHGYIGEKCNGGPYFLSRKALEAAERQGLLQRRLPWWLVLGEDIRFTLVTMAAGFQVGSIGGPGEPTITGLNLLPMAKEAVQPERKLAVHSTRRGLHGESEEELRAWFRAIRQDELSAR